MTSKLPRRSVVFGVPGATLLAWLAACTSDEPAPAPSTTAPPRPSPTPSTAAPAPAPAPATATATAIPAGLPAGIVNVLVAGSDSRSHTSLEGRSDVITLVQVNPTRTHVNLVSVARDTLVSLPGGGRGKINEAYSRAGAAGLAGVMSRLLGVKINYTLETGFFSFIAISNLLGGFTVQNKHTSDSSNVLFRAGSLTLRGDNALAYVRERKGLPNGDLDRTERHRAALTGILGRLHELAQQNDTNLRALLPQLFQEIRSNGFTLDQAIGLIPVVKKLTTADVTSAMVPIARFGTVGGASVDMVNEARLAQLVAGLKTGDLSAYAKKYGTSTKPTG